MKGILIHNIFLGHIKGPKFEYMSNIDLGKLGVEKRSGLS